MAALRRAGFARIVVAALLMLTVLVATSGLDMSPAAIKQIRAADPDARRSSARSAGPARGWPRAGSGFEKLPAVIASIDALLVLGNLAYSHWGIGLEGGLFSVFPVVWVVPITMAAAAIHYQPRLQIYVAAVYVIGLSILAFGELMMAPGETATDLGQLGGFFSPQANLVRVMMVLAAALILILVARQGRLLLERAVRETTLRVNLTRYLPRELAPILSDRAFDALRAGQRITATLLFVDIRDSSTLRREHGPDAARRLHRVVPAPGHQRRLLCMAA